MGFKKFLYGFYMIRGFTMRYFLTDYDYISENHSYFVNEPDYCLKSSSSRIFCMNSFVKVLPSRYEGSLTHLFRTSLFFTFISYRKKEIGFLAKFFSKYFSGLLQWNSKIVRNSKFNWNYVQHHTIHYRFCEGI